MFVVGGSVVAGPVFELHVGAIDFDGEPAVAAVASRVSRAEADDVVGGGVLLDALKGRGEIVRIEEGLAAGIGGESGHDFLGVEVGVEIVLQGRAVVAAGAAQAAGSGVAQGRDSFEAARIHRVDGHIGAHGSVDGGVQRGLVLNAVALDAAGEIEQRLFLVDVGERVGDVGDGKELAVGVDVVVFLIRRR